MVNIEKTSISDVASDKGSNSGFASPFNTSDEVVHGSGSKTGSGKKPRLSLGLSEDRNTYSEFAFTFNSKSSASQMTKLSTTVSVGLNGLAGKPKIS